MSTTFQDLLDELTEASRTNRDKGTQFEKLIANYLMTDPQYADRLSTRHGSRLQAASRRAVLCWPAQWRRGGGAGGTAANEGTKAVARLYRATAWSSPRGGSDGAGLAGLFASAVTARSDGNAASGSPAEPFIADN